MRTIGAFLFAITAFVVSASALAGTMYKSIGPDGSVIYSDSPPANANPVKTLDYKPLPVTPMPDSVLRYRASLRDAASPPKSPPQAVAAVAQIFTAPWCHICHKAKAYLAEKKIAYKEFNVETPEGAAALAQVGEAEGVPVISWRGKRLDGFTREAYDDLFSQAK